MSKRVQKEMEKVKEIFQIYAGEVYEVLKADAADSESSPTSAKEEQKSVVQDSVISKSQPTESDITKHDISKTGNEPEAVTQSVIQDSDITNSGITKSHTPKSKDELPSQNTSQVQTPTLTQPTRIQNGDIPKSDISESLISESPISETVITPTGISGSHTPKLTADEVLSLVQQVSNALKTRLPFQFLALLTHLILDQRAVKFVCTKTLIDKVTGDPPSRTTVSKFYSLLEEVGIIVERSRDGTLIDVTPLLPTTGDMQKSGISENHSRSSSSSNNNNSLTTTTTTAYQKTAYPTEDHLTLYRKFAVVLTELNVNLAELDVQTIRTMLEVFQTNKEAAVKAVIYARSRYKTDFSRYLHETIQNRYYETGLKTKEAATAASLLEKLDPLVEFIQSNPMDWLVKQLVRNKEIVFKVLNVESLDRIHEQAIKLHSEYTSKIRSCLMMLDKLGILELNPFERRLLYGATESKQNS